MKPTISEQVQTWLAQPDLGENTKPIMLAIEGYQDATAGTKAFMPHGRTMLILNIGKNTEIEKGATAALNGLGITKFHSQSGTVTAELTREQLQSVITTEKFRSVRFSNERAAGFGGLSAK